MGRFYYKVGQLLLLQSGTTLLQSGTGITKWDDYYKVGFNKGCTNLQVDMDRGSQSTASKSTGTPVDHLINKQDLSFVIGMNSITESTT